MYFNFCCKCSRSLLTRSTVLRFVHNATKVKGIKNYYAVLGLNNECTQKEIRNAFIDLSKEYHPDTKVASDSTSSDKDFLQLMEAYQVLSKTHSRANYDLALKGISTVHFISKDIIYEPWNINPDDYSKKGPEYDPYYGIKGLNKLANWKIVVACLIFCGFGISIQVLAISQSATFKREQLDRTSAESSSNLERARLEAEKYGNAEQLQRMKSRLRKSIWDDDS
ncbi:unnamed protein product [Diamesa serratosioi]